MIRPYKANVVCAQRSTRSTFLNAILPRELWHEISLDREWHAQVFGQPESWEKWWISHQEEIWFQEHPCKTKILENPLCYCPIVVHGDEAALGKGKRSIRSLTWSSPLSQAATLDRKLVIGLNDHAANLSSHHEAVIDEIAAWSFIQCHQNKFPDVDHLGEPFKDKLRKNNAGKKLCSWGVMPMYSGTVGDWKWLVDTFHLPQTYMSNGCCAECGATKEAGPLCMNDARFNAGWTTTTRSFSSYQLEQSRLGTVHPLTCVAGWNIHNMFEDLVHDDLLGLRQHAVASVLVTMARDGCFFAHRDLPARAWRVHLEAGLCKAWVEFQSWMQRHGVYCHMSKFSLAVVSVNRLDDFPCLKCKAAECATVSLWLAERAELELAKCDTTHMQLMAAMLRGFCNVWELCREARFFSAEQVGRLEKARCDMLLGYHACSVLAARNNMYAFNMVPKFHKLDHLCRRAIRTRVSPSLTWTFSDEDNMKWMASLTCKMRAIEILQTGTRKWLVSFFARRERTQ